MEFTVQITGLSELTAKLAQAPTIAAPILQRALSASSAILAKHTVKGTNIPANTTVAAIVSSTAYTLSQATTGAIGTQTFTPATIALKSAKVTINANVEDQEVLGNLSPADFLNKEFSVDGTMECIWQNNSDFKDQFMGPYPLAIRLDVKNTDVTLGTSTNPELILDLPKCTIQELGRPFKVKDLVYQTIKFKAVYSISDTLMLKATLTNTVNGY